MGRTRRALASPARIKRPIFYDVASVRPPDRCEYSCSYYALPRGVFRRSTSSYRARRSDDATFKGLFLFYEPWFKKKIASHVGAGVGGSCDPPFRKKGADERRSAHASAPSAAARRRCETAVAVASGRTKNESPPEEPEPPPSFAAAAAAAATADSAGSSGSSGSSGIRFRPADSEREGASVSGSDSGRSAAAVPVASGSSRDRASSLPRVAAPPRTRLPPSPPTPHHPPP